MSVPDTTNFTFQDVTTEIYGDTNAGRSLSQAFTDSNDAGFDPLYKGSKDRLSNFRNYSNLYAYLTPTQVSMDNTAQTNSDATLTTNYTGTLSGTPSDAWMSNVIFTFVSGNDYTVSFDVTQNLTGLDRVGGIDIYSDATLIVSLGVRQYA